MIINHNFDIFNSPFWLPTACSYKPIHTDQCCRKATQNSKIEETRVLATQPKINAIGRCWTDTLQVGECYNG